MSESLGKKALTILLSRDRNLHYLHLRVSALELELTAKEKALQEAFGVSQKAQKQAAELSRELTAKERALLEASQKLEDLARQTEFKLLNLQKQILEENKAIRTIMFFANPFLFFLNRTLLPDRVSKKMTVDLPRPLPCPSATTLQAAPVEVVAVSEPRPAHDPLDQQLEAKEAVIQALLLERRAWRAAGFMIWPLQRLMLSLIKRKKTLTQVRLGELRQHDPRIYSFHIGRMPHVSQPMPIISVVTPSNNQGHFLAQTIQSVLRQDYPALQYVVQDGASKDNSAEVIQEHARKLHAWESAPDRGQTHAINLGFQKTSGEIMAWLNGDDLYTPQTLWRVAQFFQKNPQVDVIYGHRLIINELGHKIGIWIMPEHEDEILSWADYVPQETLFWRRRIWDKAGGSLDESLHFAMDWDLLLRFRRVGATFTRIPEVLGCFRVHDNQKTSRELGSRGKEEMGILRQRVHGRVPSDTEIWDNIKTYLRKSVYSYWGWEVPQLFKRVALGKKRQTIFQ